MVEKYRPRVKHPPCHIPQPRPKPKQTESPKIEHSRMYGRRWTEYRTQYFSDPDNYYCVKCRLEGREVFAQVIDHIECYRSAASHDEAVRLFWDRSNHAPLCKAHHDHCTYWFDGGYGRPRDLAGKLKWYRR